MFERKPLITLLVSAAVFLSLQLPGKADAYLLTLNYSGLISSKSDQLNIFKNIYPGMTFHGEVVYDTAMIDQQLDNDAWGQYGPMTAFDLFINNIKYTDAVSSSSMNVWNNIQLSQPFWTALTYLITGL